MGDAWQEVVVAVRRAPIGPDERVLALISGGPDSTCLLHAMIERLGASRVGALHVNYGLRSQAGDDERSCRELCERLGVPLWVERAELGSGNLQAQARTARYALAEQLAQKEGFDLIATGHTASDQVETVLYRLATSPGRRALLGIADRDGRLVRPLLTVTRAQVIAYCEANGLTYTEDESNIDPKFARNRIRSRVVPELTEIHPAAAANILATRDQLADEDRVLTETVQREMLQIGAGGELNSVESGRLRTLPPALQRLILRELAERAAAGPVALPATRVEELLELAGSGGTKQLDLGPVSAVSEYGVIRFVRPAAKPDSLEPVELRVPGACQFDGWQIHADAVQGRPANPSTPNEATLDADRLGGSLVVRAWRDGDRLRPLGMAGSKSLQDLFTDRKIPRALRHRLPIVEAGGEIAWVAGVAVSDRFKVSETTERVVSLRAVARPL